MEEKQLVSVLMSVYKEPQTLLQAAIDSILAQTYKNFEFIIILDHPELPETRKFLEKQAGLDDRIKVSVNEQNIGLAASLNRGLRLCRGEYIFRMDADDISMPTRLERQLFFCQKYQLDMAAGGVIRIDPNDRELQRDPKHSGFFGQEMAKILNYRNVMPHPTWCVKRTVYESLGGYQNIVPAEDYDFLLRAKKVFCLGLMGEAVLRYRVNPQGISRSNSYRQYVLSQLLVQYHRGRLHKDIYDVNVREQLYERYSRLCFTEEDYHHFDALKLKLFAGRQRFRILGRLMQKKAYRLLFKQFTVSYIRWKLLLRKHKGQFEDEKN